MKMSFKKFISYFGVSLLSFFLVLTLTTLVIHKVKSKQELDSLKEKGYYNLVSVGDYSLNVALFGNRESENVIVCIAGLGSGDFAVSMRQMTSDLEKENLLVFIDRARYGLSEDTNKDLTNANIVEDYRLVLKNLEINGPYILMPHSIGGAYANYWCTKYPEEIKAVVFIDGSQLSENAFDEYEDEKVTLGDKLLQTFAKMGFSRYVIHNYFYHLPSNYTDEEQYLADALMYKTFESIAPINEACLIKQNGKEAFEMITPNNIPKLYICSSWGF